MATSSKSVYVESDGNLSTTESGVRTAVKGLSSPDKSKLSKRNTKSVKRRKSAETQTRLTHRSKDSKYCKMTHSTSTPSSCVKYCKKCTALNHRKHKSPKTTLNSPSNYNSLETSKNVNISLSNVDESEDPKTDVCVIETFECTDDLVRMPNTSHLSTEQNDEVQGDAHSHMLCDELSRNLHECQNDVNENNDSSVIISVNDIPPSRLCPLSINLPVPGNSNTAGTQTSPRAMVSVGINALDENATLNLLEEFSKSDQSTSGAINMSDVFIEAQQESMEASAKTIVQNKNEIANQQSDYTSSSASSQTHMFSSIEFSFSANSDDATDTTFVEDTSDILLEEEKEGYVIRDKILGECAPGFCCRSKGSSCRCPTEPSGSTSTKSTAETEENFEFLKSKQSFVTEGNCQAKDSKLKDITRSSTIETQTDHDVLIGLGVHEQLMCDNGRNSFPESSNALDDGKLVSSDWKVNQSSDWKVTQSGESAWCTSETQTCEEFSDIEQFLCSITRSQDQMRRELFPELGFADMHTQTGLEDLPYLVHSHTQT